MYAIIMLYLYYKRARICFMLVRIGNILTLKLLGESNDCAWWSMDIGAIVSRRNRTIFWIYGVTPALCNTIVCTTS